MTDDELDRLAERLADKMQNKVLLSIYEDAGRNLFGLFKKALWGLIVAFAAWGASKYGAGT